MRERGERVGKGGGFVSRDGKGTREVGMGRRRGKGAWEGDVGGLPVAPPRPKATQVGTEWLGGQIDPFFPQRRSLFWSRLEGEPQEIETLLQLFNGPGHGLARLGVRTLARSGAEAATLQTERSLRRDARSDAHGGFSVRRPFSKTEGCRGRADAMARTDAASSRQQPPPAEPHAAAMTLPPPVQITSRCAAAWASHKELAVEAREQRRESWLVRARQSPNGLAQLCG